MQITLPEIDNYTLYYETFACLFSAFTLLCSLTTFTGIHNQPLAQFVRPSIITNLPMNDTQNAEERKGRKRRRCPSAYAHWYLGEILSEYYVITTRKDYLSAAPRAESNQKLIHAPRLS